MRYTRQIQLGYTGLYELIRAAEFKMAWYEQKIAQGGSQDNLADLGNDSALLQTVLNILTKEAADWETELRDGRPILPLSDP